MFQCVSPFRLALKSPVEGMKKLTQGLFQPPFLLPALRSTSLWSCRAERGSSRDQIIVSLFLFTIFALLLTTFLRRHLLKTGLTPLEVWAIVRTRLPPWAGGGEETASGAQRGAGQAGRGETSERGYVPVSMR